MSCIWCLVSFTFSSSTYHIAWLLITLEIVGKHETKSWAWYCCTKKDPEGHTYMWVKSVEVCVTYLGISTNPKVQKTCPLFWWIGDYSRCIKVKTLLTLGISTSISRLTCSHLVPILETCFDFDPSSIFTSRCLPRHPHLPTKLPAGKWCKTFLMSRYNLQIDLRDIQIQLRIHQKKHWVGIYCAVFG